MFTDGADGIGERGVLVGPEFRLDREIRNVITVAAKTNHYWQDHFAGAASAA